MRGLKQTVVIWLSLPALKTVGDGHWHNLASPSFQAAQQPRLRMRALLVSFGVASAGGLVEMDGAWARLTSTGRLLLATRLGRTSEVS